MIKHLPRERPGRHYHAGAWERENEKREKTASIDKNLFCCDNNQCHAEILP